MNTRVHDVLVGKERQACQNELCEKMNDVTRDIILGKLHT
jgi:hypothetical protein